MSLVKARTVLVILMNVNFNRASNPISSRFHSVLLARDVRHRAYPDTETHEGTVVCF